MTSRELLALMDAAVADYSFPMLDNSAWDYAGGRVRGFRSGSKVAIAFELMVYQPGSLEFLLVIYSYGDLLPNPSGTYTGAGALLSEDPAFPLWDEDGAWIRERNEWRVSLNGRTVTTTTSFTAGEDSVRFSDGDASSEGSFVAALARELGMRTVLPDRRLLELVPDLAEAKEVARLSSWEHPDVAADEVPSRCQSFRDLAEFLAGESQSLVLEHRRDNSDRRFWIKDL
jgi:hypothetical protein